MTKSGCCVAKRAASGRPVNASSFRRAKVMGACACDVENNRLVAITRARLPSLSTLIRMSIGPCVNLLEQPAALGKLRQERR